MDTPTLIAVIDIETEAKSPDAAIGSIGAALVDLAAPEKGIIDTFYTGCQRPQTGRVSETGTMEWWRNQKDQNPTAWNAMFVQPRAGTLEQALQGLASTLQQWAGESGRIQVMGNGPEFDNVILAHAFDQYQIPAPWHFRANQSLRTAVLFGRVFLGIDPKYSQGGPTIPHHAKYDAMHEAGYLLEIAKTFKDRLGLPEQSREPGNV